MQFFFLCFCGSFFLNTKICGDTENMYDKLTDPDPDSEMKHPDQNKKSPGSTPLYGPPPLFGRGRLFPPPSKKLSFGPLVFDRYK